MRIRRVRSGVSIELDDEERTLLGQLPQLLESVRDASDPAHAVLHRDAYPDDSLASQEFADLVADDVVSTRAADRGILAEVAGGRAEVSRAEALALLRSVNEARLVVAARSGVLDRGAGWEIDARSDPMIAGLVWLGHVESELLRVLPPAD
jgi:Domain of unknown function (DUF2017)